MKSKCNLVALMVVILSLFAAAPVRAECDSAACKPPPCHDDRTCPPPCETDDDDNCPGNHKLWICYIGNRAIDGGSFFTNTPWVERHIKASDLHKYKNRLGLRVVDAAHDLPCPWVELIPTAGNHAHDMSAKSPVK